MPDFRPAIRGATQCREPRIVIPPSIYRLAPEEDGQAVWSLKNVRDLKIVADGVTLISSKLTCAVASDDCRNVTLQGFTTDYDPLPFTQGTVVTVAENQDSIDVKIHAGYPLHAYSRIDVVDPKTRFRKKGMPFRWGLKAAMIGADVVRVTRKGLGSAAAVGDLASLSTGPNPAVGGTPHAVTVHQCADTTFCNVTVHSAPGMGIIESGGEERAKYLGCRVVRGPTPAGATEARLLTTWRKLTEEGTRIIRDEDP